MPWEEGTSRIPETASISSSETTESTESDDYVGEDYASGLTVKLFF